jgi:recombination protein RecT
MKKETRLSDVIKEPSLQDYINSEAVQKKLVQYMNEKDRQRFCGSLVTRLTQNPTLKECTRASLVSAALLGEMLGLSPSQVLGHYYIVPFRNKQNGTTTASFQLGYKGYLQLAIRTGKYKRLTAIVVKEGELVKYSPLEESIEINFVQDEALRSKLASVGYYAYFELIAGYRKAVYWTKSQVEVHASQYSQSYNSSRSKFWTQNFDDMALKTVLRQLLSKWGIVDDRMVLGIEEEIKTDAITETDAEEVVTEADPLEDEITKLSEVQEND